MIVNVQEAKTRLSELLKQVEAGQQITIARAGKPIAELRPAQKVDLVFGSMSQLGPVPESFFEPLSQEDLALWGGGGSNDPVGSQ